MDNQKTVFELLWTTLLILTCEKTTGDLDFTLKEDAGFTQHGIWIVKALSLLDLEDLSTEQREFVDGIYERLDALEVESPLYAFRHACVETTRVLKERRADQPSARNTTLANILFLSWKSMVAVGTLLVAEQRTKENKKEIVRYVEEELGWLKVTLHLWHTSVKMTKEMAQDVLELGEKCCQCIYAIDTLLKIWEVDDKVCSSLLTEAGVTLCTFVDSALAMSPDVN